MTYRDGGWAEGEPEEDDAWDQVGQNPTGRKTRSSAGKRRQKLRKLFRGTQWEESR